ncbi:MAG: hypothetical protein HY717_22730 [Planctomycetes bacterium]|nr:hypothetical protein [Planctomycetota bacterium]
MDGSRENSPAKKSQVFIAGFHSFDLFYVPSKGQIVSQFRLEKSYPWQSLENSVEEAPTESPDENLR